MPQPSSRTDRFLLSLYRWLLVPMALPWLPLYGALGRGYADGRVVPALLALVTAAMAGVGVAAWLAEPRHVPRLNAGAMAVMTGVTLLAVGLGMLAEEPYARRLLQETGCTALLLDLLMAYMLLPPRRALGAGLGLIAATIAVAGAGASLRGEALHPLEEVRAGLVLLSCGLALGFLHVHTETAAALATETGRRRRAEAALRLDSLTGVPNRREADARLATALGEHEAFGMPVCFVLVDLDRFKELNDRYGHPVGDRALRAAAEALRSRLRPNDLLARWGGEEFAAILPRATLLQAERLAEEMRRALRELEGADLPHLSASFGVAQARPGDAPQDLVERADRALYRAKRDGRDRVAFETRMDLPGTDPPHRPPGRR